MPRFFFNLKDGRNFIRDTEGTDLPDEAAARAHASDVARELLRNSSLRVRMWRLNVCDCNGVICFELLFASIDESISRLGPELRQPIEEVWENAASLSDALGELKMTLLQVKGTLARSSGRPYIAAVNGTRT